MVWIAYFSDGGLLLHCLLFLCMLAYYNQWEYDTLQERKENGFWIRFSQPFLLVNRFIFLFYVLGLVHNIWLLWLFFLLFLGSYRSSLCSCLSLKNGCKLMFFFCGDVLPFRDIIGHVYLLVCFMSGQNICLWNLRHRFTVYCTLRFFIVHGVGRTVQGRPLVVVL